MKYIKHDSYDEYKAIQTQTNKDKLGLVWVTPSNIEDIGKYCNDNLIPVKNIICHGTRNAAEIELFNKSFPNTGIIGTEISDTATQFTNTIQWDFHDENPEWEGQFDIVYSNSWDHSYDFKKALKAWSKTVSPTGRIFLDWNNDSDGVTNNLNKSDCCGCTLDEFQNIINKYCVVEAIFPIENKYGKESRMVVIKNQ